jgi:hypothetical protein
MPTLVEFEEMCFEMYYKGYHSSHIKLTYGEYCYRIDIKKIRDYERQYAIRQT